MEIPKRNWRLGLLEEGRMEEETEEKLEEVIGGRRRGKWRNRQKTNSRRG